MEHSTEIYRGYEIQISYDTDAQNPFTEWDGQPAMRVQAGRYAHRTEYNGSVADIIDESISEGQLIRNQKALMEILGLSPDDFKGEKKQYKIETLSNDILYADIEQLTSICKLFKIPHVSETQSYDQSTWAEVLIVSSKEWIQETGIRKKHIQRSLQASADLYQQYASGEVFGYNCEEAEASCWGYYGDEHEKSGLMEEARSEIDYTITSKRKARFEALKTLIRNRVPHYLRYNLTPSF